MRVLYVNHTARMSGAEHSLLSVLSGMPSSVSPALVCPEGPFADAARSMDLPVFVIPDAEGSLRLQPIESSRTVAAMARAAMTIRHLIGRLEADLVHANSIRAGVATSVATWPGGPPDVVYVRDCLPPGPLSSLALGLIASRASAVVANSNYTAASFQRVGRPAVMRVAYSPVDVARFDPIKIDTASARRQLGIAESAPVLTVVAQLTPWKGQDDAIRVVAELRRSHPDVRLLIAGTAKFASERARYDNEAYQAWLGKLAFALGLTENVRFLGERDDVPTILAATDLLLVPSWEEPFGRAIVEGMAMERPVIATSVGGPAEVLGDGEAGLLLPPHEPELWARWVAELLGDPSRRAEMGRKGRKLATERFAVDQHVESILSIYGTVLDGRVTTA